MPLQLGGGSGKKGGMTLGVGGGSYRPDKPKRDLRALWDQVIHLPKDIIVGGAELAKVAYGDLDMTVGDVLPGSAPDQYRLDDIGGAIVDDFKVRYAPLFKGEWSDFLEQIRTRPLDFILDAAALITMGGSVAANASLQGLKASSRIAKVVEGTDAAAVAARGARAVAAVEAGSRRGRAAGYVPATPENLARAERTYGKLAADLELDGYVPGVREVGGGRTKEPLLLRQHKNPVKRARQRATDVVMGSRVMDAVPGLNVEARAGRQDQRPASLRAEGRRNRSLPRLQRLVRTLSPEERVVWAYRHESNTVSIDDHVRHLETQLAEGALPDRDLRAVQVRLDLLKSKRVQEAWKNPSKKLNAAVQESRHIATVDMPEILIRAGMLDERGAASRRMVTSRVVNDGAKPSRTPKAPADAAARKARALSVAEKDAAARARRASLLLKAAAALRQRIQRAQAARRDLRMVNYEPAYRPQTFKEWRAENPDAPLPYKPGEQKVPTQKQAEGIIRSMRAKMTRGKWGEARRSLESFVEGLYDEARYGTRSPSKQQIMREAHRVKEGRARGKRKELYLNRLEVDKLIEKHGAWSPTVVTQIDRLRGTNRTEMWKFVREERAAERRSRGGAYEQSLGGLLERNGYSPDHPQMNLADDDKLAELLEEYLREQTGEASLVETAFGRKAGDLDQESAQGILQQARRGDPDLDVAGADDVEVAQAWARTMQRPSAEVEWPRKQEWVDDVTDSLLQVFELRDDHAALQSLSVGGRSTQLLEALGGDPQAHRGNIEVLRSLIEVEVQKHGFTPEYLQDAAALRVAQRQLAEEGPYAFAEVTWVPDVDKVPLETVMEFVPDIPPELLEKLKRQAVLTKREASMLRGVAYKLENEAKNVARPGVAARAAEREAKRMDDALAGPYVGKKVEGEFDDVVLAPTELASPDGTPYRVTDADTSTPDLEAQAAGEFYYPHKMEETGVVSRSSARASGAVKRMPEGPKRNVGALVSRGLEERDPEVLMRALDGAITEALAVELLETAIDRRAIPFDEALYAAEGAREWVVIDPGQIPNLARKLKRFESDDAQRRLAGEVTDPEVSSAASMLDDFSSAGKQAAAGKVGEGAVMVPRRYMKSLASDFQKAPEAWRILVMEPLKLFRTLTLFTVPGYYVNNIVGQHMLLAVAESGPQFLPAYVKFLATKGSQQKARIAFAEAARNGKNLDEVLWSNVLAKHAAPLDGASFVEADLATGGRPTYARRLRGRGTGGKVRRSIARAMETPEGMSRVGAILSDDLPRQFRFYSLMRPHIKAAKRRGEKGSDAEIAMRVLDQDQALADRITMQTLDDLIDYRSMSAFEREYVRGMVPFYGWLRGMTEWSLRLGFERPEALWAMVVLAGPGARANEEWESKTPEWMGSSIRLGEEQDGKQLVLNTVGLNPFQTFADVTEAAGGLVSGDVTQQRTSRTIVGQLNPFVKALGQAWLNDGKEFGTGYKMGVPGRPEAYEPGKEPVPGGVLGSAFLGALSDLRPVNTFVQRPATIAYNEEKYGTPGSETGVYQSPWWHYWMSYAGAPIRTVDLANAQARREADLEIQAGG